MSEERAKFFTPTWFGALFRGEHTLGDTFWGGAFGAQLVILPIWVVAEFFIQIVAPTLEPMVFLVSTAIFLGYSLALTCGVFIVARRSPKAGFWRWAAVAYCVVSVVIFAKLFASAITEITV